MRLHTEQAGHGEAVVLLHPGLCDCRMWEPHWEAFAATHRVVRLDLPGFGRSPLRPGRVAFARSVLGILDELAVERAAFVGVSLGGRVALELAVAHPERVSALVLVRAGTGDHEWSDEVRAFRTREAGALERGDLDAAIEANLLLGSTGRGESPARSTRSSARASPRCCAGRTSSSSRWSTTSTSSGSCRTSAGA